MIFLDHLLSATSGSLLHAGKHTHFETFNQDSRQLLPGELFVAVRGERGDGHDYLLEAAQRGAAGLLVEARAITALSDAQHVELEQSGVTTIIVEDTRMALQHYVHAILRRWHPTVIAVTGSVGKTSTKEAIARVLSGHFATFKSWQNYNDALGLPLSLGRLEERHEYAVLELACDHPGEIRQLCQITQPSIGVLTNISPAQLQYFGTLERLAGEYGQLLTMLPSHGLAIVNGDDPMIGDLLANCRAPIIRYHPSKAQNVRPYWALSCDIPHGAVGTRFIASAPTELDVIGPDANEADAMNRVPTAHITSRLLGRHHVATMLAAMAVGQQCGLSVADMKPALANVSAMPGRLQMLPGVGFTTLLDDTHNAAPASVAAGLETVREIPASYRIAVLGDMLRLGDYAEEAHRMAGQKAAECVDYLIVRGEYANIVADAARKAGMPDDHIIITSTHEDAAQAALQIIELPVKHAQDTELHTKDLVYIKGSEETRMERVTERLMAEPEKARAQLVRQTPGWKQITMTRPIRPTWVEIDLSAIAHNTRQLAALVGPRVRILASLKADAYGHGAVKVGHTVLRNGASMLGVATVSEAIPLREAGISAPILVFGYIPAWQMREAVRLDVTLTLYSIEAAQAASRAAQALGRTARAHIKVDSGMGRLGIRAEELESIVHLVRIVRELPGLQLEGIFTHFAMADARDQVHTRMQFARFQNVLQVLEQEGIRPPLAHAANSAATLAFPAARLDMVRPGIALFGLHPSEEVPLPETFRPALSFKTQVSQVKLIPAGECISYGCAFYTERATTAAVLPVGYADGFRRAPTNWGSVLIHGQPAPLLGRVCMDQCMVDVSHIPQTRVGDEVVLIGRQGSASLTAEQVAQRLGTINYEVVSEILARVPRVD